MFEDTPMYHVLKEAVTVDPFPHKSHREMFHLFERKFEERPTKQKHNFRIFLLLIALYSSKFCIYTCIPFLLHLKVFRIS